MILNFKSFIKESIWSDIQKRSSGDIIRKEDGIVIDYDIEEMYDYLCDTYKDFVYWFDGDRKECIESRTIGIDPIDGVSLYFDYKGDGTIDEIVFFYTIKSLSNAPKKYPEVFKKLCDKFDVSKYNTSNEQWSIKDKSGDLTNKTVIDVINFFLSCGLKEGIWSNIQKRSSGEIIRKEDDVNRFDKNELCEYLKSKYYEKSHFYLINKEHDRIIVNILQPYGVDWANCLILNYDIRVKPQYINLSFDFEDYYPKLYDLLNQKYLLKIETRRSCKSLYVYPKDKEKITNKFFIDLLEFIIENVDNKDYLIIGKK